MEITVAVIDAGRDEVAQHLVDVGSADKMTDRHAHLLCIPCREDVAEVAGRNGEREALSVLKDALLHHRHIGGDIINDLRHESAPVDRIRRGELHAVLGKRLLHIGIGEDRLDAVLAVVEIALDRADTDIFALLRLHLALLHRAHAVLGIEDHDARARDILKACECCLAGVAGGCREDDDLAVDARLPDRTGQEMRQDLECHILEGAGRTVPELQKHGAVCELRDLLHIRRLEIAGFIGILRAFAQLLIGEIGEIELKEACGALGIGKPLQRIKIRGRELRDGCRHEQTAVCRDALCDRLCAADAECAVSCAVVYHVIFLLAVLFPLFHSQFALNALPSYTHYTARCPF